MIRILFLMQDLGGGGAERSLLELLSRLDRRRFGMKLFLLRRTGVHLDRVPTDVQLSWGQDHAGSMRPRLPIVFLKALGRARDSDVIVAAMEGSPSYFGWLAAYLLRKPLVCWIKTDLDEYLDALPSWHRRLARLIYPHCELLVVPSVGSLRSLERVIDLPASKRHVINNPVDLEEVREMASAPIPPELRELTAKPFVLGVGRLINSQKGFDLLVRAHAFVLARGVDHNLVIIGEGPDRDDLERLAHRLLVGSSTFLPGFQKNPFPFFKAAKALAAPARLDGFGRVYLEAMALGLPIVCSHASGPAEILQNGRYGIAVPPEDPVALGEALFVLLTSMEIHQRYTRLSLERARHYDPNRIAADWDGILRNLIEPAGPPAPGQLGDSGASVRSSQDAIDRRTLWRLTEAH